MAGAREAPRLYFLHVGDSDRPLPAFAWLPGPPDAAELARELGEPAWRSAAVFELGEDLLRSAVSVLASAAGEEGSDAPAGYRLSIVRGGETPRALALPIGSFRRALAELGPRLAASHPDAAGFVEALLRRLPR